MAKSSGLSIEQVQAIVEDPDLDRDELAEVLQECFGVTLPPDLQGAELADFIYKTYQEKASEIAAVRKESKKTRKPGRKKRGTSTEGTSTGGSVSRAAFIIGIIEKERNTTRKALETALGEAFNYAEAGKSPRTRVNRVLRNLKESGKIELEGGNVKWVG